MIVGSELYIYIYIYIHTHTHTHTHTYIYTYIHIYIDTYIYIYLHVEMVVGSEGGITILLLVSRSCYWYHDLATVHGASGREF